MLLNKVLLENNHVLIIRKAEEEDAEQIIAYINQVTSETHSLTYSSGEFTITVQEEKEVIADYKKFQNKIFLIAYIHHQIVSVLTFAGEEKERKKHIGELGITVKKEFWNLGIGNSMMKSLLKWAKSTKIIRKINLVVQTDNKRAVNLYKKFNFKKEGIVTRDSFINGVFYDSYIMGLQIDEE
jgi:RimJ/RimL family protein N-acetyltransferase